ncbi:MAG: sulfur carrier protein ThiS [Oxalobacteraceae bacterium]|nr:sulfur carrier protein ThiS [Oxalobacteraceae bacterium]
MHIELNGAPHPITDNQNVQDLIVSFGLQGKGLAVAVNRQVVPHHLWQQRILQENDRVEIVQAIGGV